MDLSQELDDYIRESIDYSLGLPVRAKTLELKLRASEEAERRLRDQYMNLRSRLSEKDEIIERAKAESSMNAQAVKKFVEENQKLAMECSSLLNQCAKWETECSMYDRDREALMDFGNEADQRAKDAENRLQEFEEEFRRLSDELQYYKHQSEKHSAGTTTDGKHREQLLLDSLLTTLVGKDEFASKAHDFLEANNRVEVCHNILEMWNKLKPSTQKVVALAAEVQSLKKDKEHLRINLQRAEEEVRVLAEENNVLDGDNRKLMKKIQKERQHSDSGGKHSSSASAKASKRKYSDKLNSSSGEKRIDLAEFDSPRQPLSPLQYNSPESRLHKK